MFLGICFSGPMAIDRGLDALATLLLNEVWCFMWVGSPPSHTSPRLTTNSRVFSFGKGRGELLNRAELLGLRSAQFWWMVVTVLGRSCRCFYSWSHSCSYCFVDTGTHAAGSATNATAPRHGFDIKKLDMTQGRNSLYAMMAGQKLAWVHNELGLW